MSQTVTIKVTQGHIDAGGVECDFCPVFHALRDAGLDEGFEVFESFVEWACPTQRRAPLPASAVEFIARNDNSDPTEPFEFELDLPDGVTIKQST